MVKNDKNVKKKVNNKQNKVKNVTKKESIKKQNVTKKNKININDIFNNKLFMILLIVIFVVILSKILVYIYFQSRTFDNNFSIISDNVDIYHKSVSNKKYKSYNGLMIKDDFNNFDTLVSTDDITTIVLKEGEVTVAAISVGKTYNYVQDIKQNGTCIFKVMDEEECKDDSSFAENLLVKYNIEDNVNLMKYVEGNQNENINLLSNLEEMKEYVFINNYINYAIPSIDSLTYINGDYYGYILDMDSIKEVNLINGSDHYYVTFFGNEYFDEEYIYEIISTIKFE